MMIDMNNANGSTIWRSTTSQMSCWITSIPIQLMPPARSCCCTICANINCASKPATCTCPISNDSHLSLSLIASCVPFRVSVNGIHSSACANASNPAIHAALQILACWRRCRAAATNSEPAPPTNLGCSIHRSNTHSVSCSDCSHSSIATSECARARIVAPPQADPVMLQSCSSPTVKLSSEHMPSYRYDQRIVVWLQFAAT
jgi:hypothetical protein